MTIIKIVHSRRESYEKTDSRISDDSNDNFITGSADIRLYSRAVSAADTSVAQVKGVKASNIKDTAAALSWSKVSKAKGYRVYVYDKAAAESAFAKVKKTAKEYGWTITETFVNRSTNKQYGIYCNYEISETASADGKHHIRIFVIKSEVINNSVKVQASQPPLGGEYDSKDYDDYSEKFDISYVIDSLKDTSY